MKSRQGLSPVAFADGDQPNSEAASRPDLSRRGATPYGSGFSGLDTMLEQEELQQQIEKLEQVRTMLGDAVVDQKISELRAGLLMGQPKQGGGPSLNIGTMTNSTAIIGNRNRVYQHFDADTPAEDLLDWYLSDLAAECGKLPLDVIDPGLQGEDGSQPVSLNEIYVGLDVVDISPEASRKVTLRDVERSERLPLLDLLERESRLVLLGDPGSGKSTFINYMSGILASGQAADELPDSLRGRLPLRLILRELAAVPEAGKKSPIWQALGEDIGHRDCLGSQKERLLKYMRQRIGRDGAIFFLDGMDEVPEQDGRRSRLVQAIQSLAGKHPNSRFIVTARPYAYSSPAHRLQGFRSTHLQALNEKQQHRFIDGWYMALRRFRGDNRQTSEHKAAGLRNAVSHQPHLRELAGRPLLLTLMATLHSSEGGELPDGRAELYERSVDLLLKRWQRHRLARDRNNKPVIEESIAQLLESGLAGIREVMEQLALHVHQRQLQDQGDERQAADIRRGEILEAFEELLHRSPYRSRQLIDFLNHQAGLLVARHDDGPFRFPHRSFQEYLAACAIVRRPGYGKRLRGFLQQEFRWWREPFLLGAGRLCEASDESLLNLVNILLPLTVDLQVDLQGQRSYFHWRAAALCAEALIEQDIARKREDDDCYRACYLKVQGWLQQLLLRGELGPKERAQAGDLLGRLGDPRRGVGLNGEGLPDIQWQEIPAGYRIGRYPVTVTQFGAFVAAEGYVERAFWTETGWAWCRGELDAWEDAGDWAWFLKERPLLQRATPWLWEQQQRTPNRPVTGVNWWEAYAFCRWLAVKTGGAVTLPTSTQWQRAAAGPEGRDYPWGNWREDMANTQESGIGAVSPVGCFPAGGSTEGMLDMAGNVWEWCLDLYAGGENPQAKGPRVLHGGAFYSDKDRARGSCRDGLIPVYYLDDLGFRVLCSPAPS